MSFTRLGMLGMSFGKRTVFGELKSFGLPLVFGGAAAVAGVSVALGASVLVDRECSHAFPAIVAEYVWILAWVLVTVAAFLPICWLVFAILSRRIAGPVSRLAETVERATLTNERVVLDEHQRLDEISRLAVSFNRLLRERDRKSDEIRNLSRSVLHDLRTPLVQMYDEADRLAQALVEPKEAAAVILRASRSLLRVVETNAEISRNYSGSEKAEPVSTDLVPLVADVADVYAAAAESKGVGFACDLPDGKVNFVVHESKIRRLVGNLLDNAIKFTAEGGRVSLRLTAGDRKVRLEVSDTGCGIPVAEQDKIYERFYRGAAVRELPGMGLGLAMVHSIVMFYHGDIACTSEPGHGTSFVITFPQGVAFGIN